MEPSSKKNLKENSLPKNVFEAAETLLLPKIFAGYRAVVEKWLSGRETAELPESCINSSFSYTLYFMDSGLNFVVTLVLVL